MKENIIIRILPQTKSHLQKEAIEENRSLNNLVAKILNDYTKNMENEE